MSTQPQENRDYRALEPLSPIEIERGERLLYRLTEFGRILWEVGIDVGPRKMLDLAETLNYVDLTNKEDFYHTLKCSLLAKHEQEAVFDQMYMYYWYIRDAQNKKKAETPGAAKRDDKHMRLPPSESDGWRNISTRRRSSVKICVQRCARANAGGTPRKRPAIPMTMIPQRRRDWPTARSKPCARRILSHLPGTKCRKRNGSWLRCAGI